MARVFALGGVPDLFNGNRSDVKARTKRVRVFVLSQSRIGLVTQLAE